MAVNEADTEVRNYLVWLLESGDAHMTLDTAVSGLTKDQINMVFPNSTYSFWGALEHIRRTQVDILEFIKDPDYKERDWPDDYWPERGTQATKADWDKTLKQYRRDLKELIDLVKDPATDLYKKIPWGNGQTVLREILLVADHTAYEIGEMASMRRVFGHWDISHP
jgi:hypothetical protein